VLLSSLVVALLVHPLQFPFTQLLEGYWGPSWLGRFFAVERIRRYRQQLWDLDREQIGREEDLVRAVYCLPDRPAARAALDARPKETAEDVEDVLDSEAGDVRGLVTDSWMYEAVDRERSGFPVDARRVMPTRLGNVLRRYEDQAGRAYGLDALTVVPHLALLAPTARTSHLRDAREAMDLAIRMCLVSLLATALSVAVLATDGVWLLLALVPYSAVYVSYLGAVAAAHEYGTAVTVLIDLDRFALYKQLQLAEPADTGKERKRNRQVMKLLSGEDGYVVYVSHPDTTVKLET
jgi:hypothetical protein